MPDLEVERIKKVENMKNKQMLQTAQKQALNIPVVISRICLIIN